MRVIPDQAKRNAEELILIAQKPHSQILPTVAADFGPYSSSASSVSLVS
jgi:hypothetical protein